MLAVKLIVLVALITLSQGENEIKKKDIKRGIEEYGYNGWASTLKLNPVHELPLLDRPNVFVPSAYDLNHLVAAAKQAAHDVFLAQQYVAAAKEDVLFSQKLVKEKEAQALIAHQKSESAQHVLRSEAQNAVLAQQKLAKAKAFAAEQQLKQAVKDAEAARALQSSANSAHSEIQKAEQAAKLAFYKQSIKAVPGFPVHPPVPAYPSAPWAAPFSPPTRPIVHNYHPY